MKISCALAPGLPTPDYAVVAEQLGYDRVWLYDSPALYGDVYVGLARIAERTKRIGLGTGVAVPSVRHPMATASAIADIELLAPGRLACAFGTGFSARLAMGKKAMTWARFSEYIRQLRGLLAGDIVEIDGAPAQMIHGSTFAPDRPIRTPILIAAMGPKGTAIARELGDGAVFAGGTPQPGFDWCGLYTYGTVLDPGEDLSTPRVREAIGPIYTTGFHGRWEWDPASVDASPGGREWREALEADAPEGRRHLLAHRGHLVEVTERDRPLLDVAGDLIQHSGMVGHDDEVKAKIDAAGAAGATEILYAPSGPDIPRELRAFARAAGL
jgi:5,10-methylenetetrahydromethanopterin reductase